jgi:hypothetical protein
VGFENRSGRKVSAVVRLLDRKSFEKCRHREVTRRFLEDELKMNLKRRVDLFRGELWKIVQGGVG